jgi:hypothetical protein
MADLEEHAFRRDRRFIVRLVLILSASVLASTLIFGRLTSEGTAGCAAEVFEGAPAPAAK